MASSLFLLCFTLVTLTTISATSNDEDLSIEEVAVDDLKDLLFTSMHNIVSLNELVTELTEKVSRLTISFADVKAEMKMTKAETVLAQMSTSKELEDLGKKISKVNDEIDAINKDGDSCDKGCEEEKEDGDPLDGEWTCWEDWSECSATCGGGTQTRNRSCTDPAPAYGGAQCEGNSTETQECNTHACPVDGGWSDFGDWSECSATCEGGPGFQTRNRNCTNPVPAYGGVNCVGNAEEFRRCNTEQCPVVLKFGQDQTSYIERQPDMRPLQNALSVCAWVRKLRSGSHTIWYDYAMSGKGDAMCISDDEYWNCMVNQCTHNYRSLVTVRMGRWYHHCSTWKQSTGTWRVYHDGTMIGERTSPGGILKSGGYVVIGNDALNGGLGRSGSSYQFGGELTKMNIFSSELSADEVKEMRDEGILSSVEMKHEASRYIKWEDILTWERTGTVTDRVMTAVE